MDKNHESTMAPYVGAPYNFVPFHNKVIKVEKEQMAVHDKLQDELLSGEIDYKVTAVTPIFIGDGDKEKHAFVKNEYGKNVIPGSSMRGLIRNNVQILGLAGFSQDIEDYELMYRAVASGTEKEKYKGILGAFPLPVGKGKSISVLKEVKAGYMVNKNGKLIIYKTDVDSISKDLGKANYYVVSERIISENLTEYPFFTEHPECTQYDIIHGFTKKGNDYIGNENSSYVPFFHQISYELKDSKRVINIGEPGVYTKSGYLLGSGFMKKKKVLYVIPRINKEKEYIEVSEKDKRSFQIDYEKRLNSLKGQKHKNIKFFNIPEESDIEPKPVFYVELGGRIYFGFTPRLRLFYEHSVKEGYHLDDSEASFDYAKSLFGMSSSKKLDKSKSSSEVKFSFRSKVSFSDAVITLNKGETESKKLILAEPKPTSYGDYLVQEKEKDVTYNNCNFNLRGVKQYWLHKEIENITANGNNEDVASTVNPLNKGTEFTGRVRFRNLTPAELGLLLWGMELTPDSMMNIGKGKAYGLGVIKLSDVKLRLMDYSKAYNLDAALDFSLMESRETAEFIRIYKNEINSKLEGRSIDRLKSIKTFFMMKERIPEGNKIRYMEIGKSEYQKRMNNEGGRLTPLPTPKDIVGALSIKKEISDGGVNEAIVKEHKGKKVKLFIEGNYPWIPVENIVGIPGLNKNNLKEKLPKDSVVKVRYFKDGDTDKYEIVN